MIPQPITLHGKTGTIMYLDAQWHPVTPEQAMMAKVVFDDGSVSFYTAQEKLHSVAKFEKPEGLGGITRKFDAAQHPRGEDGRFIEATAPRIFSRMTDVGSYMSWGEKKWGWRATAEDIRFGAKVGEVTGRLLTGEPIPRENLPETLYHVTTNAPAVEASGVLLGLLGDGGLGGGQAPGVSFTSSKEDAFVIQRELRRAVRIARGEVDMSAIEEWAQQDELMGGLREGALKDSVASAKQMWEGNEFSLKNRYSWQTHLSPEAELEANRRSLMKDVFNAYLNSREYNAEKAAGKPVPFLKNPILFGKQEQLAKLNVQDIQILEATPEDIPAGALVTTGSDKFLHEVRVYADVPRKLKKAAREYVREPAGSPKGGEFAQTQQGARAVLMDVMDGPVGVDDHPVAIRAAHETAAVLREMKAKGYPMPHEVEVRVKGRILSGEADRQTLIVRVPDHLPPEMSLDEAFEVVYGKNVMTDTIMSRGEKTLEVREYVGRKFRDLVIHEMGHLNRRPPPVRDTDEAGMLFSLELSATHWNNFIPAANTVSYYARNNPDEFVAEAFTALYNGEKLPADTMRVYHNLRGATVL